MTTLHLGINDVPYVDYDAPVKKTPRARKGKANKPRKAKEPSGGQTTGQIAEILEAKYHIMETFAERHLPGIADSLAESMAGALKSIMMGAPASQLFGEATDEIKAKFQKFLDDKEMDGATGVPTQAAKDGVNHRLKRKRGPPRSSFIDTGQYQTHFQDWIDDA